MSVTATAAPRPRFGRIKDAVAYSSRSRGRLYQLASENPGLFVKDGASTLVNFDKLDAILDALPDAGIHMPARTKPQPQPEPQRRERKAKRKEAAFTGKEA